MKIQNLILKRLYLLIICLLTTAPVYIYSQQTGSCAEKLKNAQTLFDKGQVELVSSILGECLRSGFNREESLAAYKLLIQSYLFEDKLESADSVMMAFLKKNPEYKVSPTDHSSFVYLFNKFRVRPVVQITFHLGSNLPFITFVDQVTLAGKPAKYSYSSEALNLFGSVEAKIELNEKLDLSFEAGYSQLAYKNVEDFMGIGKTNYAENQKRLEFPVSVTYDIKSFGRFTPYGRVGMGPALTISSDAKTDFDPYDLNVPPHPETDLSRKDSRIFIDLFTQVGAGMKFKIPGGFLISEIRANFGIINQAVRGGESAEELGMSYYYIDDDFHLNTLNFSVGYTLILYKPSKRKE